MYSMYSYGIIWQVIELKRWGQAFSTGTPCTPVEMYGVFLNGAQPNKGTFQDIKDKIWSFYQ